MPTLNITPLNLGSGSLSDPGQMKKLQSYLLNLTDQLRFTLNTLSLDDLGDLTDSISGSYIKSGSLSDDKLYSRYLLADTAHMTYATIENVAANYADINLANIAKGTITSAMIKNEAVGTSQIADGSITDAKIVELTANKITAGTLSVERLVIRDPVTPANSLIYAINNITGALQSVQGDTLNGEILTERTITADKIVAGAITANEIAAKTITANSAIIDDAAISSAQIASLDAGKITTGQLSAERIDVTDLSVYKLIANGNANNYAIMDTSSYGGLHLYNSYNGITPFLDITTTYNGSLPLISGLHSLIITTDFDNGLTAPCVDIEATYLGLWGSGGTTININPSTITIFGLNELNLNADAVNVNGTPIAEEGTWTPVLTCKSGGTAPTYTKGNWVGRYYRTGNMVYIQASLRATITDAGSGYAAISGLPYASLLSEEWSYVGIVLNECYSIISGASGTVGRTACVKKTEDLIWIQGADGAAGMTWVAASGGISFSGWYQVETL